MGFCYRGLNSRNRVFGGVIVVFLSRDHKLFAVSPTPILGGQHLGARAISFLSFFVWDLIGCWTLGSGLIGFRV